MAIGGVAGGMTLYVKDGIAAFDYNYYGDHTIVRAAGAVEPGPVVLGIRFDYEGGGIGKGADITLSIDGVDAASGHAEKTVFARFGVDTFGIGEDTGQPVTPDYRPPFRFTGRIERELDDNEQGQRRLQREQDGSEVKSVELEL